LHFIFSKLHIINRAKQKLLLNRQMGMLKEDKQPYSQTRTVLGNLGIILWISLGSIAFWFYNSVYAWIYLFFAIVLVFAIIRRSLCKTCAYCKKCTMGSSKLSELVFGKAELGGLSPNSLIARLIFIFMLLTGVPTVLLSISISQEITATKIILLASLLMVSLLSIISKRKREFMKNQFVQD